MRRLVGSVVGSGTVAVLVGLSLAAESFALPPARALRRPAAREADDAVAPAMEGEAGEAAGDDDAADRAAADDVAADDAAAAPAKGRPGVKQIEDPEGAAVNALEDPEAARRAQFGDVPPFVFPGMAIPGFPPGAFPFVPPGAGAAAGNGAGNGAGVGVVQQFGFSGVIVGGNAVPGGNGFVVRTFQIGPDGAVKEVPQPEPPAADRGQREPGKAKAKAKAKAKPKPNAKPEDAAAAERAAGKAKAAARDDDAKEAKAPRAKQNAKAPRAAAAP